MCQNQLYSGKNKKIGILGGTFNPVHKGHMNMAKQALESLRLDRVVFMVCANPPHKSVDFDVSVLDRRSMLSLAIEGNDKYIIDDYEANMKRKAYTYKSLQRIKKEIDKTSHIYFIIGADSLMYLDKWKRPDKLFKLSKFAVIPRGDVTKIQCTTKIEQMTKKYGGEIIYIDCEKVRMSSTLARDYNYEKPIENLDNKVAQYIKENGLYKR